MRKLLIASVALVLLVVLPGVVIKRGPHSSSGQTGDGSTPLSNLFYMGPNSDEQCIAPDTDENPGLRHLARLIARTILSEHLTQGEVPVSLDDENRSG